MNESYQYLFFPGTCQSGDLCIGCRNAKSAGQLMRIADVNAFTTLGNNDLSNANFAAFQQSGAPCYNNVSTHEERTNAFFKGNARLGIGILRMKHELFERWLPATRSLMERQYQTTAHEMQQLNFILMKIIISITSCLLSLIRQI
jgi:hypothetical protein